MYKADAEWRIIVFVHIQYMYSTKYIMGYEKRGNYEYY